MPEEPPPPADPSRHALFLDFDGTLVDFADDPEAVSVAPALVADLKRLLLRFDGALALVSGRAIASLDRLLAPAKLPIAGVHGLEIRRNGSIESNAREAARLEPARRHLRSAIGEGDRISVEDKGGAIVLHFRTAPSEADRAREIAAKAASASPGLVAVDGHAIAEIRPKAITKAGAIGSFMDAPPFCRRLPVFIGDDVTDEDGFVAVEKAGGFAVKVGSGRTAARYRLADVTAVHAWLHSTAADTG